MSSTAHSHVKHLRTAPDGRKLRTAHKAVLSQLADDHNEDRGVAWPSIPNLAARAIMSREHCRRLLRELESMGVLESRPRLRENGGRSSSEYRFCLIDPPFDTKDVARVVKLMRLQDMRRKARAVQMLLAPAEASLEDAPSSTGIAGGGSAKAVALTGLSTTPLHTEEEGGELERVEAGRVNVAWERQKPPPTHLDVEGSSTGERESPPHAGGPPLHIRVEGPSTPERGGKEPLIKPLPEPKVETALEPFSPLPPEKARGVSDAKTSASWRGVELLLKSELYSIPANLAAAQGFTEIVPGEHDFDACFRDWWLVDVQDGRDVMTIRVGAAQPTVTQAGIDKYASRLDRIVRKFFNVGTRRTLRFVIVPAQDAAGVHGVTLDSWELVKQEVRAALLTDPPGKWRDEQLRNFDAAIGPAVVAETRRGGGLWKLASRKPGFTREMVIILSKEFRAAVQKVAGGAVTFEYVKLEAESEDQR